MQRKRLIVTLVLFLVFSEGFVRATAWPWKVIRPADAPSYHLADGYFAPDDHSTMLYQVRNGERRTVGQPAQAAHTLWMFGNSALFGFKIADADTLSSKLQALLTDWRVVNRSAEGQYVRGELNWLMDTPVKPGDTVIFYDGLMEALIWKDTLRSIHPFWRRECDKSQTQHLSLILDTLICDVVARTPIDQEELRQAGNGYQDTIERAQRYSAAHGAAFYHFIQPGAMETYGDTARVLPGVRLFAPPDTFLDPNGHLNARGNETVARAIYDYLTIF